MRKRESHQEILQNQIKRDCLYNLQRIGKRGSLENREELRLKTLITLLITIQDTKDWTTLKERLIDSGIRITVILKT